MGEKKRGRSYTFTAGLVMLGLLSAAPLAAQRWFVVSPAARLNPESPAMGGQPLSVGAELEHLDTSGLFLKVRHNGRSGYVSRLFVSEYPPSAERIRSLNTTERSSPRRRASDLVETVAARGYETSRTNLRVRGAPSEYDFSALDWIEAQQVEPEQLKKLLTERLQNAAP